jgi:hypothetical protein
VEQVLTTPAEDVKMSGDGRLLIYMDKKGGENAWRKHHTSAIARDIWIYDIKAGTHRRITTLAGEDRSPVFTDGDKAFYYLSEESGTFNVHKMSLQGGKSQQITSFKKVPVRFLSTSEAGTLCFGYDGEIYTKTAAGQPQKVTIAIAVTDAKSNNERVVPVTGERARDGRVADRQGGRVHLPRRGLRRQRRRRRHQAHHEHARTGTQRQLLARRQGVDLRVGAGRPLEDL